MLPCTSCACECDLINDKEDDNVTMATVSTAASLSSSDGSNHACRESKVRFCSKPTYHEVESLSLLSSPERQTVWYTPKELQSMKAATQQTAVHILSKESEDTYLCLRYSYDGSMILSEATISESSTPSPAEIEATVQDIVTCLTEWVSASSLDGEACRGTEKMLLRKDQSYFAKEARKVVLNADSREWEKVAERYGVLSTHAVVFATTTADADFHALA